MPPSSLPYRNPKAAQRQGEPRRKENPMNDPQVQNLSQTAAPALAPAAGSPAERQAYTVWHHRGVIYLRVPDGDIDGLPMFKTHGLSRRAAERLMLELKETLREHAPDQRPATYK